MGFLFKNKNKNNKQKHKSNKQNNQNNGNNNNENNSGKQKEILFYIETMLSRKSRNMNLCNIVSIPFKNNALDLSELKPTIDTYITHSIFLPDINSVVTVPLWYNETVDGVHVFISDKTELYDGVQKTLSDIEWKIKTLKTFSEIINMRVT